MNLLLNHINGAQAGFAATGSSSASSSSQNGAGFADLLLNLQAQDGQGQGFSSVFGALRDFAQKRGESAVLPQAQPRRERRTAEAFAGSKVKSAASSSGGELKQAGAAEAPKAKTAEAGVRPERTAVAVRSAPDKAQEAAEEPDAEANYRERTADAAKSAASQTQLQDGGKAPADPVLEEITQDNAGAGILLNDADPAQSAPESIKPDAALSAAMQAFVPESAPDADPAELPEDAAGTGSAGRPEVSNSADVFNAEAGTEVQAQPRESPSLKVQEPARELKLDERQAQLMAKAVADAGAAAAPQSVQISEQPAGARGAALSQLMADAGVVKVSAERVAPSGQGAQLAQDISADLSLIDESLQASAALDGTSDQGGQTAFSQQENSEGGENKQNLNGALQILKAASGEQAAEAPKAGLMQSAEASGKAAPRTLGEALAAADARPAQAASAEPAFAQPQGGAVPELSQSRLEARSAGAQALRESLITLSGDLRKNAAEISQAVMAMAAKNVKRFEFSLNPEGLGTMQISIDADSHDEAVKISIGAGSEATRSLIAQSLDTLRDLLSRNGVNAETELSGGSQDSETSQGRQGGQDGERGQERGQTFFASGGRESAPEPVNDTEAQSVDDGDLSLFA